VPGDPSKVNSFPELKNKLTGFTSDALREQVDNSPNARKAYATASCRILNNCNEKAHLLSELFHEGTSDPVGAQELRRQLRGHIRNAVQRAIALLKVKDAEILKPWSISQLLSGIRGLLYCKPFHDAGSATVEFEGELKELARELTNVIADPSTFKSAEQWKGIDFSTVMLGLRDIHRKGLVKMPDPQHLLAALSSSLDEEHLNEWDARGYANCLDALCTLIPGEPAFASETGERILNKLVAGLEAELENPYSEVTPADCMQVAQSLLKLHDAGVRFGESWAPSLRALCVRIRQLGNSAGWKPAQVKAICDTLHEIVRRKLFRGDEPSLLDAVGTLAQLGSFHGPERNSVNRLCNIVGEGPAETEEKQQAKGKTRTTAIQPEPAIVIELQPEAEEQPPLEVSLDIRQPQAAKPPLTLKALRRCAPQLLATKLMAPGAKEVLRGATTAELLSFLDQVSTFAPDAKAVHGVLMPEIRLRLRAASNHFNTLCEFVEALAPFAESDIAPKLLKLMTKALRDDFRAPVGSDEASFAQLETMIGTLAGMGLPAETVDPFLHALAKRIKADIKPDLNPAERQRVALEVLACELDCAGVSSLFGSLWGQEVNLPDVEARNAYAYKILAPKWAEQSTDHKDVTLIVTVPPGTSRNVVAAFVCGHLDRTRPPMVIKGNAKAVADGSMARITWIRSKLGILSGEGSLQQRTNTYQQMISELMLLLNPYAEENVIVNPRIRGELRIFLSSPVFYLISALKQSEDSAVQLMRAMPAEAARITLDLIRIAVKAHGTQQTASTLDDVMWFVDKLQQAQGRYATGEAVAAEAKLTHALVNAAKLELPASPTGNEASASGEVQITLSAGPAPVTASLGQLTQRLRELAKTGVGGGQLDDLAAEVSHMAPGHVDWANLPEFIETLRGLAHERGTSALVTAIRTYLARCVGADAGAKVERKVALQIVADLTITGLNEKAKGWDTEIFELMQSIMHDWNVEPSATQPARTVLNFQKALYEALKNSCRSGDWIVFPPSATPNLISTFIAGMPDPGHVQIAPGTAEQDAAITPGFVAWVRANAARIEMENFEAFNNCMQLAIYFVGKEEAGGVPTFGLVIKHLLRLDETQIKAFVEKLGPDMKDGLLRVLAYLTYTLDGDRAPGSLEIRAQCLRLNKILR
jgi:hypothetical protein